MEIKIVILMFSLFLGCISKELPKNIIKHQVIVDTLPPDAFIENKFVSEDKYIVKWGTSKFTNTSKDTFGISGSGSLEFSETNSNSKFIASSQLCGSGCTRYVIFPLEKNARELDFIDVEYINIVEEIIITTTNVSTGEFLLTKLSTKQWQKIKINDMCPAADKSMCIDSIFLKKNQIVFLYQGNKWETNKPDNKVKVLDLK
jgi:hypothetical protein